MNTIKKIVLIAFLFINCCKAQSTIKCSFDKSVGENVNTFFKVLIATKKVKISLKIEGSDEYLVSDYNYEVINLNSLDYILRTGDDINEGPKAIGVGYNMYFGLDINDKEIDFYVFQPTNGLDRKSVISFKEYHSDGQCMFKSAPHNEVYSILKVLSPTSFSYESYYEETHKRTQSDALYYFTD